MVSANSLQLPPPFPDDVPVAKLSTISLARLFLKDKAEIEAMFQACQQFGFFQLDLQGDTIGEEMVAELEKIFDVIDRTMRLPQKDKIKYRSDPPKSFAGFKLEGAMKTETGQDDRCTFFQIHQDDILGIIPEVDLPEPVRAARQLLKSYTQHGQHALSLIFAGLENQLGLPLGTLRDLHSLDKQSSTILRMIRYSPSITPEDMRTGLLPHTDYGSVTLLANILGGLQVLKPGTDAGSKDQSNWQWVKPQPGCLIVNLGDALVEWTGGVLRSNLHRVYHAPGDQRLAERFSFAMLVRPRYDAKMERISGGLIPQLEDDKREGISASGVGMTGLTASEWEKKKAMRLMAGEDIAQSRGGRAPRVVAAS